MKYWKIVLTSRRSFRKNCQKIKKKICVRQLLFIFYSKHFFASPNQLSTAITSAARIASLTNNKSSSSNWQLTKKRMAEKTSERCVLCLDEKRSPVRITCGHSFCNECLDVYKSYQKYAWANRCPICRGSLKDKRRSVKKPMTMNSTSTTTITTNITGTNNTATTATNNSNSSSDATQVPVLPNILGGATLATPSTVPIEQIYLLEEFMAIATQEAASSSEDEYYTDDDEDQEDFYYFNDDVDEMDNDDEDAEFDDDTMDHSEEDDDNDVVALDDVIIID